MNKTLARIEELCKSGGAMTTTPIKPHIQAEIEVGNVKATAVRCGPLGVYTGEVSLTLTESGKGCLRSCN